MSYAIKLNTAQRYGQNLSLEIRGSLMAYNTTYHSGMAGYLMDFGFGGFIGYGKGMPVGLEMEELNRCDR